MGCSGRNIQHLSRFQYAWFLIKVDGIELLQARLAHVDLWERLDY
jgi:hypothetical protein